MKEPLYQAPRDKDGGTKSWDLLGSPLTDPPILAEPPIAPSYLLLYGSIYTICTYFHHLIRKEEEEKKLFIYCTTSHSCHMFKLIYVKGGTKCFTFNISIGMDEKMYNTITYSQLSKIYA